MSMQIMEWDDFISVTGKNVPDGSTPASPPHYPLAITIGVFDGVHLGHQSLIHRICSPPPSAPSLPTTHCGLAAHPLSASPIPTVVTFRQNPMLTLNPAAFPGDIIPLGQKLSLLETLGVQLTVLIDFSEKFSTINGRDFIDLLLLRLVKLIVLGRNFRCGHGLDTGAEEIRQFAETRGVETCILPPVMDGGERVSSSRIRQALASGRQQEAERLLNWPKFPNNMVPK